MPGLVTVTEKNTFHATSSKISSHPKAQAIPSHNCLMAPRVPPYDNHKTMYQTKEYSGIIDHTDKQLTIT